MLLLILLALQLPLAGNSTAAPVLAAVPKFYAETNITRTTISVNSGDFKLSLAGIKAGFNVTPKIALEAHFARGLSDDSIGNLTTEIPAMTSLYARLGSTVRKNIRSYILLGQSNISLDYAIPGASNSEDLEDFSWAIGAEERLRRWRFLIFNAEYVRHYDHDGRSISSFSIGLRHEF